MHHLAFKRTRHPPEQSEHARFPAVLDVSCRKVGTREVSGIIACQMPGQRVGYSMVKHTRSSNMSAFGRGVSVLGGWRVGGIDAFP